MTYVTSLKHGIFATATLAMAGSIGTALADGSGGAGGYHHMWGGGGSMMFMGSFMMIFFLIVVVVIAVIAAKWFTSSGDTAGSSARAILDERFARGEIDADEYRARREALEK